MKRLITERILIPFYTLVLAGFLFLGLCSPVGADTFNVPGDFASIQAAIDDAGTVDGDTIIVGVGTFTENLIINKRLKLLGARTGENACVARAGGESVIDSTGNQVTLVGGSAGTIINGFTFTGATPSGSGSASIRSTSGPIDNLQILNNIIVDFEASGIFLNDNGTDVTINQNRIDGSSITGSGTLVFLDTNQFKGFYLTNNCLVNNPGGNAFFVDGNRNVGPSFARNPLFSGNLIDNITGSNAVNFGKRALDTATIRDNTFSNNVYDVAGGPKDSLITRNLFDSNGTRGLRLTSFGDLDPLKGAQGNTVTANCFLNTTGNGIEFSSGQAPGTITTNIVNGNNFTGNGKGAFYGGSETINATGNFWGAPDGPSGDGPGTGDIVDGASGGGSIDFSGFLTDSAPGTPCTPPANDHFQCYDVKKATKLEPRPIVSLNDQFGFRDNVKVNKKAESYCTPVDKNGEGVINPDNTLTCYKIEKGEKKELDIVVNNQFGEQEFELKKPKLLCVPSTQISVQSEEEDEDDEDGND